MKRKWISALLSLSLLSVTSAVSIPVNASRNTPQYQTAPRQMEKLNRGLIASYRVKDGRSILENGVYLSWRLLGDEDLTSQEFDIYRNDKKIYTTTGAKGTCYIDTAGGESDTYKVVKKGASSADVAKETAVSPAVNYAAKGSEVGNGNSEKNSFTYIDIPIERPAPVARMGDGKTSYYYTYDSSHEGGANDASVGDLDGDGDYEIVLKWDPTDSKDSAGADYTGNVYIDAYEIDPNNSASNNENGHLYKWRIDLGKNVTAGAHYTQFIVYDFDGDGRSEIAMKTAPGSVDGQGNYVSAAGNSSEIRNVDNSKSYVGTSGGSKGKNLGPEYLTVFDGETGAALMTTDYIPLGTSSEWGDSTYNRGERFLAGVAYLDGVHPSIIMCRGYYAKAVIRAYRWDGADLIQQWEYNSDSVGQKVASNSMYGQGNHNLSIADIDNDGKDEIIYGSACLDDDGKTVMGNTKLGHGDALHVSDFNNDGVQEAFSVKEDNSSSNHDNGGNFRIAKDGTRLFGLPVELGEDGKWPDVGRGVMDNIDDAYAASNPNALAMGWTSYHPSAYDLNGNAVAAKPSSAGSGSFDNFLVYWDGDLGRELLDANIIQKYYAETGTTKRFYSSSDGYSLTGGETNNYTKRNYSLVADIWGDWREEVIMSTGKGQDETPALRIFTSTLPTDYRLTTLMHDCQYRESVAWQNVAYNQPAHTSYYIGSAALASDSEGNTLNYLAPAIKYTNVIYESPDNIPVTGITISHSSISMAKSRTTAISASAEPSDATKKGIIWTSSNESIVTVSNGILTAVSEGTATITAETRDGGFTAQCYVKVLPLVITDETGDNVFEFAAENTDSNTTLTSTASSANLSHTDANSGTAVQKTFKSYTDNTAKLSFRFTTGGQKYDGTNWDWTGHEYSFGLSFLDTKGNNIITMSQGYTSSAGTLMYRLGSGSSAGLIDNWNKVIDSAGDVQGSAKRWIVTMEFDYDNDECSVTLVGTDSTWATEKAKYTKIFPLNGASFKTMQLYTTKDGSGAIKANPILEEVKYTRAVPFEAKDRAVIKTISGNTITVEGTCADSYESLKLLGALYDGDMLKEIKIIPVDSPKAVEAPEDISFTNDIVFENSINEYTWKVFLWNSLDSITPLVPSMSGKGNVQFTPTPAPTASPEPTPTPIPTLNPNVQYEEVFISKDNFLMSDNSANRWIISSDGKTAADGTATASESRDDINGNSSSKLHLSDKAVQYVLNDAISSGYFRLSYDMLIDKTSTSAYGRYLRTYLDNTAHAYDAASGKASEMGTGGAFFHMMDYQNNVYTTSSIDLIAAGQNNAVNGVLPAEAHKLSDNVIDGNKWYRVIVEGDLSSNIVYVSYYPHNDDGTYTESLDTSAISPLFKSMGCFTDSRTPSIKQIKLMRTAGGSIYYDNIKLEKEIIQ